MKGLCIKMWVELQKPINNAEAVRDYQYAFHIWKYAFQILRSGERKRRNTFLVSSDPRKRTTHGKMMSQENGVPLLFLHRSEKEGSGGETAWLLSLLTLLPAVRTLHCSNQWKPEGKRAWGEWPLWGRPWCTKTNQRKMEQ